MIRNLLLLTVSLFPNFLLAENSAPSSGASPTQSEPVGSSTISVPIRVPLSALQERLNQNVPADFTDDVPFNFPGASHTHANFTIRRGGFTLSAAGNGSINFSCDATIQGVANYNFGPIKNHTKFDGAATISGNARPEATGDWQIRPNLQFAVQVKRAHVNIGGLSVAGLMSEQINRRTPGFAQQVSDGLNRSLGLQGKVNSVWASAFRVIELSNNPEIFLSLTPRSVEFVQPTCSSDGIVTSGAQLVCDLALAIGSHPETPSPTSLPAPQFATALQPAFRLFLPVTVQLAETSASLQNQLAGQTINVDEDHQIGVSDFSLQTKDSAIQLDLNAIWKTKTGDEPLGHIQLTGRPILEQNGNKLSFDDLDYTLETRNRLINTAAWLAKPFAVSQLGQHLTVDLSTQVSALNGALKREVEQKLGTSAFQPEINIQTLQANKCVIGENAIVALFEVGGECAVTVGL